VSRSMAGGATPLPLSGHVSQPREEERVWPALAGWLVALALLGALLYVTLTNMPAHHLVKEKPAHWETQPVPPQTPPPELHVWVKAAPSNVMVNGQPIHLPHQASPDQIEPTPQAPVPTPWIETESPIPNATVVIAPVASGIPAASGGLNTAAIVILIICVWLLISALSYAASGRKKTAEPSNHGYQEIKPVVSDGAPAAAPFHQVHIIQDSAPRHPPPHQQQQQQQQQQRQQPAPQQRLATTGMSSEASDAKKLYDRGCEYQNESDYIQAVECFERAALQRGRRGKALYRLGQIYNAGGHGVAQNKAKAFDLFKESAELGHSGSQNQLGHMIVYDKLGPTATQSERQQWDAAAKYFRMAAEQGSDSAQCNLGLYYMHKEPHKDFPNAIIWLQKAADKKMEASYLDLAVAYAGARDFANALRYFEKAAATRKPDIEPHALYNIGVLHHAGYGVPQNEQKAIEYLRRAADLGEAKAIQTLAKMEQARSMTS